MVSYQVSRSSSLSCISPAFLAIPDSSLMFLTHHDLVGNLLAVCMLTFTLNEIVVGASSDASLRI